MVCRGRHAGKPKLAVRIFRAVRTLAVRRLGALTPKLFGLGNPSLPFLLHEPHDLLTAVCPPLSLGLRVAHDIRRLRHKT